MKNQAVEEISQLCFFLDWSKCQNPFIFPAARNNGGEQEVQEGEGEEKGEEHEAEQGGDGMADWEHKVKMEDVENDDDEDDDKGDGFEIAAETSWLGSTQTTSRSGTRWSADYRQFWSHFRFLKMLGFFSLCELGFGCSSNCHHHNQPTFPSTWQDTQSFSSLCSNKV